MTGTVGTRRRGIKKNGLAVAARTALGRQARNFLSSSSLHGVRYIAQSDRPLLERAAWLGLVAAGGAVAAAIIVSLWDKFQTSPTITGLDTDFHNWDVAFPAVSICPIRPTDPERVANFVRDYLGSEDESKATIFINALANLSQSSLSELASLVSDLKRTPTNLELTSTVFKVVHPPEEVFGQCTWVGEPESCSSMFFPAITEVGLCYCFNANHSEAISPWNTSLLATPGPRKIYETDVKWTITVDFIDSTNRYKVYIHSADILPGGDASPQHIWDGTVGTVLFSAKETYTTDDARQLSVRQRRCVFADEQTPPTGGAYTHWACSLACHRERQRSACQCAPHFRPPDGKSECNLNGLLCLSPVEKSLFEKDCPCELGCSNTVYEVEKLVESTANSTMLQIGFESWPMIKYKREVLFGWVDLLVSFGGIAGLFLGFSLLSAVELVYYFTLRACCSVLHPNEEEETPVKVEPSSAGSKATLWALSAKELEVRVLQQARRHKSHQHVATQPAYPAYAATHSILPYLE